MEKTTPANFIGALLNTPISHVRETDLEPQVSPILYNIYSGLFGIHGLEGKIKEVPPKFLKLVDYDN